MGIEKWDQEDTSYSDEYDRETVALCRKHEAVPPKDNSPQSLIFKDLSLYFIRGERYANKSEAINSRRKALQEYYRKLEKAELKFKVLCLVCRSHMDTVEKTFYGHGKDEQILFCFKCGSCREVRRFFEDGTEHRPQPPKCDACGAKLEKKFAREGNKIITSFGCRGCGHSKDEILDLDEIPNKPTVDENFVEDRKRFCMTEEEGREYLRQREFCDELTHRISKSR